MRPVLHPACAAFPALPEKDLQELATDIRNNGLLEAITLTPDGLLLDGRCRWDACERAGVEPRTTVYDGDPISFVLSKNKHRRHLDVSQQAMAVARLSNLQNGSNQFVRKGCVSDTTLSKTHTAEDLEKLSGVTASYINFGRTVLRKGEPHIIKMVDDGKVSVRTACEAVRHHPDRTVQAGWTEADVQREGRKIIRSYPSAKAKAATAKPAEVKAARAATPARVDIPYGKPIQFPTPEETGLPPPGASIHDINDFHERYGRTPLFPKTVKHLLEDSTLTSVLAQAVLSFASEHQPTAEAFFEAIDHMLAYVPQKGGANGAQIDFAAKGRTTLALLERSLPKAQAFLAALDAKLKARRALLDLHG